MYNAYPEELLVAVRWWKKQLCPSIPLQSVNLFERHLLERCFKKFEGHWFPENSLKGHAFRSITFDPCAKPDPLLSTSAQDSQIDISSLFPQFLEHVVMWIDPGEVIVRAQWSYSPHRGTEEVLYPIATSAEQLAKVNMPLTLQNSSQKLVTSPTKYRPNSPPKTINRKNEGLPHHSPIKQQQQNNVSLTGPDRTRRESNPKNNFNNGSNNSDNNLNVYSSVFVPSNYDYWSQHDRLGLTVTV